MIPWISVYPIQTYQSIHKTWVMIFTRDSPIPPVGSMIKDEKGKLWRIISLAPPNGCQTPPDHRSISVDPVQA